MPRSEANASHGVERSETSPERCLVLRLPARRRPSVRRLRQSGGATLRRQPQPPCNTASLIRHCEAVNRLSSRRTGESRRICPPRRASRAAVYAPRRRVRPRSPRAPSPRGLVHRRATAAVPRHRRHDPRAQGLHAVQAAEEETHAHGAAGRYRARGLDRRGLATVVRQPKRQRPGQSLAGVTLRQPSKNRHCLWWRSKHFCHWNAIKGDAAR
jgi:hypothetical protein